MYFYRPQQLTVCIGNSFNFTYETNVVNISSFTRFCNTLLIFQFIFQCSYFQFCKLIKTFFFFSPRNQIRISLLSQKKKINLNLSYNDLRYIRGECVYVRQRCDVFCQSNTIKNFPLKNRFKVQLVNIISCINN